MAGLWMMSMRAEAGGRAEKLGTDAEPAGFVMPAGPEPDDAEAQEASEGPGGGDHAPLPVRCALPGEAGEFG